MSNATKSLEIKSQVPDYVGWRGELLTELALTRLAKISGIEIFRPSAEQGYDFLIGTSNGLFVFIKVKAFSSSTAGIPNPDEVDEFKWRVSSELIKHARQSRSPVLLFLFDADTDHGRFIRLDTVAETDANGNFEMLVFPRSNTINQKNLSEMIAKLA